MTEKTPLTTARKFDPTLFGLHTNQQVLAISLAVVWSLIFMASSRMFADINTTNKLCFITALIEIGIFFYIGKSQKRLYRFECSCRFIWLIFRGEDYVDKYSEGGMKRAKEFSHIKWIHKKGAIEYFTKAKTRPHNWGSIIWLDAFDPEVLKTFVANVERMLIGVNDNTVLKTTVNVRKDLKNYAEPITIQLNRTDLPQIVRESMEEHEAFIKIAQIKSFENYMLVLIPYTSSKKKALKTLDITVEAILSVLQEIGMKNSYKLESATEVREAFFGQVTYNLHQKRRLDDDASI